MAVKKRSRWMPGRVSTAMTLWLTLVWVAVFASVSPLTIVSGILTAALVQLVFPMPSHRGIWRFRPLLSLYLLVYFAYDLVRAGLQVSRVALTGRDHDDGIVRCDLRSDNAVYMTIVAAMTSMIPGTIVVEASQAKRALYLHCLDLEAQGGVQGIREATWQQEKRVLFAFAPRKVLQETGLWKPGEGMIKDDLTTGEGMETR